MRDDAMGLIEASARKMIALVGFARVAFGAATSSERFSGAELGDLVAGLTEGGRATLDWRAAGTGYSKLPGAGPGEPGLSDRGGPALGRSGHGIRPRRR